jgi:hypothetical protein
MFAAARAERILSVLPYCPAKAGGFDFLRICLSLFFSGTSERFTGTLRQSRAHHLDEFIAYQTMKGTVPQERRQLLKKINARDQNPC